MVTTTEAARVRARVDHPIIDADGHFVELGPLLHEELVSYVEDVGGPAMRERFLATAASFDTSSSLADRDDRRVREQWKAMPSWWGWQTAAVRDRAPVVVRRTLRTARQCMSPMEGRGLVAAYDRRLEQLVLYSSTQMPHIVRTGLAGCLGMVPTDHPDRTYGVAVVGAGPS